MTTALSTGARLVLTPALGGQPCGRGGGSHPVETLATEPERYVQACVYELSLKINRDLRKELEQYDVEVQRRGRVNVDEINEEIEEAKERLEKAYRRRARYFLRAVERREQEKTT